MNTKCIGYRICDDGRVLEGSNFRTPIYNNVAVLFLADLQPKL